MTPHLRGRAIQPKSDGSDHDLRLLPWSSPDDKPCFLSTSDGQGVLSRYADGVEAAQLAIGAEALTDAADLLADPAACRYHLRIALQQTARSLSDALRIAESRGARLYAADPEEERAEETAHQPQE
ncbi:hypothetical protein FGW37_22400 [Streptomyces rectiverticillatus]|uniref:hypothetical protein n=1 Tax=Streptomyces rectiverticillatus TaxID=173860 RepID=UPI0015C2FAC0|nr:hypothetical protein [Streptomyces rectiverticillatus]QLE73963.1 hypothetical protein FGW37_22400 [Streptomyces rectiverticillatus]